jgi:fumarate hydratase subunit alpha
MREIQTSEITDHVARMCQEANFDLGADVLKALEEAEQRETSPTAKYVLQQIMENASIASAERVPMCQDCGVAVFFVELGQDVHIVGGDINDAINEGVRKGYGEGYLRKSIVASPLPERINTGDNTPAVIHFQIVPGDKLKIIFAPKGAGSENMSALKMLKPADGIAGIKQFVLESVKKAGPNPCPPIIVGVGIGGTFEKAAILAKKALLRPIGQNNLDGDISSLERELLQEINSLGIGPAGFGGLTTALAVNIETYPCHIGSLPVAVNINCHAARHREVVI